MKKIKSYLLYLVLVLLLVTYGCGSMPKDFFGTKTTQDYFTKPMVEFPFEISKYYYSKTINNYKVEYTDEHGHTESSIQAWGSITGNQLYISVSNYSNMPISTNYFADEFLIITTKGKILYMEKCPISSLYPSEYINPGIMGEYCLQWWSLYVDKSDVAAIICSLGIIDKTTIVLRPLPLPNKK